LRTPQLLIMKIAHFHILTPGLFLCFIFSLLALHAQTSKENNMKNILSVPKCHDFELTGDGSSRNWKQTGWNNLEQYGIGPKYHTKFKILYSETGIYCLYQCEDEVITATLNEDFLDLWNEDVIEAFFWTDESSPIYFEYELSPLNYELPILVPNYSGQFLGWRPWHYEGDRKTRHSTFVSKDNQGQVTGWTGEFFIPFALLKPLQNVPPQKGTRWRANFYRIDYDKGESQWCWQPVEKTFHEYLKYGTLVFE
jgi:hypothetical protein